MTVTHPGAAKHHIVTVNLLFTTIELNQRDRVFLDGTVLPGSAYVTPPGTGAHAVYQSEFDQLHIYASEAILSQCFEDVFGRSHDGPVLLDAPRVIHDLTIERLAQVLAAEEAWDDDKANIFSDSIARAIVSRLVEKWYREPMRNQRQGCGLPRWRLRRATGFIEEHLGEKIRLDDIARSAGLSRMHFAAQFRVATGVSPHEYVLRRRVELAKTLMLGSNCNTLDIALQCGFGSQAHFIMVFSRFMGETPSRWRRGLLETSDD
ncbi:AraC family transcriptional regulator [Caballeronia sp. GAFFF1]|uniref:helix-turn-helix domain-containing protein n=1 Tax=Caballeronia sp. GAFFF1 TaxID=2921779 RepID=UPI00202865E8|nr:AraC family transcriptional regulator [Caballeronia sp. GAFFF1]